MDLQTFAIAFVAAGGGGATIAVGVTRFFGEKWLEGRFGERLQRLRHEQEQELERLRFNISRELDRATKLSQREFEVLPTVWAKVHAGYVASASFVSSFRTYPDFARMPQQQFEETVQRTDLADFQKAELLALRGYARNQYYPDAIYWAELHRAKAETIGAVQELIRNRVFLTPEIYEQLQTFARLMQRAVLDYELDKQLNEPGFRSESVNRVRKEGEELHEALAAKVQARFWDPQPSSAPNSLVAQ